MKRKILSVLMAVFLLTGLLSGCTRSVSFTDCLDDYVKTLDYHDGFTILQLTDLHWSTGTQIGDETYGCEAYLLKLIDEVKTHAGRIDLIEITGDTLMLSTPTEVRAFIDFMTTLEIPYAIVWGNHDREGKYNPNWFSRQFAEAPYSLYTEIDGDDVNNRSNYVINLVDENGNAVWQIMEVDSGASYREGAADLGTDYDFVRDDQIAWMTAEHEAAGADVPVLCYYHIAQAEVRKAWEAVKNGEEGYSSMFFKLEGFGDSEYAPDMTGTLIKNNVKGVFMGHAHSVDLTMTTPEGIVYGFGVKTGKELYYATVETDYEGAGFDVEESFDLVGASLVTLNDASGGFTLEHLYYDERDEGDFVKWVTYR